MPAAPLPVRGTAPAARGGLQQAPRRKQFLRAERFACGVAFLHQCGYWCGLVGRRGRIQQPASQLLQDKNLTL